MINRNKRRPRSGERFREKREVHAQDSGVVDEVRTFIREGSFNDLDDFLDARETLSKEVADVLMSAGSNARETRRYRYLVLKYIKKMQGFDHQDLVDVFMDSGDSAVDLVDFLKDLEDVDHERVALRIIENGDGLLVATDPDKFEGLSVEVAGRLAQAGYGEFVREHPERFKGFVNLGQSVRFVEDLDFKKVLREYEHALQDGAAEDVERARRALLSFEDLRVRTKISIREKHKSVGRRVLSAWRWLGDKNLLNLVGEERVKNRSLRLALKTASLRSVITGALLVSGALSGSVAAAGAVSLGLAGVRGIGTGAGVYDMLNTFGTERNLKGEVARLRRESTTVQGVLEVKKKFEEYARVEMNRDILDSEEYRYISHRYAEMLKEVFAGEVNRIRQKVGKGREGGGVVRALVHVIQEKEREAGAFIEKGRKKKRNFALVAGLVGIAGFGSLAQYADEAYEVIQEKIGGYFDLADMPRYVGSSDFPPRPSVVPGEDAGFESVVSGVSLAEDAHAGEPPSTFDSADSSPDAVSSGTLSSSDTPAASESAVDGSESADDILTDQSDARIPEVAESVGDSVATEGISDLAPMEDTHFSEPSAAFGEDAVHVVREGESVWSILEDTLRSDRGATPGEVADAVGALRAFSAEDLQNIGIQSGDIDRVYPGDTIDMAELRSRIDFSDTAVAGADFEGDYDMSFDDSFDERLSGIDPEVVLHTVERGESLWSILKENLHEGAEAKPGEIAQAVQRLGELKPDVLKEIGVQSGDIKKIFPGDTVDMEKVRRYIV